MLRKVKLYGKLAEFVGHKELEAHVNSVGQAVSFLINNFPGLESYMGPKYYQVKVGDYDIEEKEISYPVGQQDIHFIPVIKGAGGDTGRILMGVALITVGVLSGGATLGLSGFTGVGFLGGVTAVAGNLGIALVLSGVSNLLSPEPKQQKFESEQDPRLSFSFSGIQNTSRAGTSIPIIYGEMMCGSVVISVAVDTHEVAV